MRILLTDFSFPLLSIFLQKSQGLLKLKLYAKLFRQNAIRLISFEKRKRVKRKFKKIMNGKVKNAMAALLLVAPSF